MHTLKLSEVLYIPAHLAVKKDIIFHSFLIQQVRCMLHLIIG